MPFFDSEDWEMRSQIRTINSYDTNSESLIKSNKTRVQGKDRHVGGDEEKNQYLRKQDHQHQQWLSDDRKPVSCGGSSLPETCFYIDISYFFIIKLIDRRCLRWLEHALQQIWSFLLLYPECSVSALTKMFPWNAICFLLFHLDFALRHLDTVSQPPAATCTNRMSSPLKEMSRPIKGSLHCPGEEP